MSKKICPKISYGTGQNQDGDNNPATLYDGNCPISRVSGTIYNTNRISDLSFIPQARATIISSIMSRCGQCPHLQKSTRT